MATAKETAKEPVKAEYVQRGETLDYKNIGTSMIPHDSVVSVGTRIGIAGADIAPGETGALHMAGVYKLPKTATTAISMGAAVYFDGEGITTSANDGATTNPTAYIPAGYAAAPAQSGDDSVLVKLPG